MNDTPNGSAPATETGRSTQAVNDAIAADLRARFAHDGTFVVNLISAPGSGKTTLLESTLQTLLPRLRLAVIEADLATERDSERVHRLGARVHQVHPGAACHLDARQVADACAALAEPARKDAAEKPEAIEILFVENVGDLVCPVSHDLGEDAKVALLSVTEGEDKPFKYPALFARAPVTIVTKADLLAHVPFALGEVLAQVRALRPDGKIFVVSARTGEGMEAWTDWLEEQAAFKQNMSPVAREVM